MLSGVSATARIRALQRSALTCSVAIIVAVSWKVELESILEPFYCDCANDCSAYTAQ